MGILKTKGLRPLVQNRFPFATKTFSKIRGILELNQTKSANGRTDGRINLRRKSERREVRSIGGTDVPDEGGNSIKNGPRGYLEKVLPVYGPLVSYVPDGD